MKNDLLLGDQVLTIFGGNLISLFVLFRYTFNYHAKHETMKIRKPVLYASYFN